MTDRIPKSVTITDDTMREGLQVESADIPVSEKLRLPDALGETGAKVISIGSFAHPKRTPLMACIDEIAEKFVLKPGITYTAAVFNLKGFERADKWYPRGILVEFWGHKEFRVPRIPLPISNERTVSLIS